MAANRDFEFNINITGLKDLQKLESVSDGTVKTLGDLASRQKKLSKELSNVKKGTKNYEKLEDELKTINKTLEKTEKQTKQAFSPERVDGMKNAVESVDESAKGLNSNLSKTGKGIKGLGQKFKKFGKVASKAVKGLGIAGIVALIGGISSALGTTQKGFEKMKAIAVGSQRIFAELSQTLMGLVNVVVSLFDIAIAKLDLALAEVRGAADWVGLKDYPNAAADAADATERSAKAFEDLNKAWDKIDWEAAADAVWNATDAVEAYLVELREAQQASIGLSLAEGKLLQSIEKNQAILDNTTKSYGERRVAIRKVIEDTKELFELQENAAREKFEEAAAKIGATIITDEDELQTFINQVKEVEDATELVQKLQEQGASNESIQDVLDIYKEYQQVLADTETAVGQARKEADELNQEYENLFRTIKDGINDSDAEDLRKGIGNLNEELGKLGSQGVTIDEINEKQEELFSTINKLKQLELSDINNSISEIDESLASLSVEELENYLLIEENRKKFSADQLERLAEYVQRKREVNNEIVNIEKDAEKKASKAKKEIRERNRDAEFETALSISEFNIEQFERRANNEELSFDERIKSLEKAKRATLSSLRNQEREELSNVNLTEAEKERIREKYRRKRLRAEQEYNDQIKETQEEQVDNVEETQKEKASKTLEAIILVVRGSQELLNESFELESTLIDNQINQIQTQIEGIEEQLDTKREEINELTSAAEENLKNIESLEEQLSQTRKSNFTDLQNDLRKEREERKENLAAAKTVQKEEEKLLKQKEKQKQELARQETKRKKVEKQQAIANALINGALAITQINAHPAVVADLSQALRITLTTLTAASTAAQVATISAQKFKKGGKVKKYEEGGGLAEGPSHENGGIPFTVAGKGGYEMEGGEYIVNKDSTAKFLPLLESINSKKFATGGQTAKIQNTKQVVETTNSNLESQLNRVVNRRPVVSVQEISDVSNSVDVLEKDAEI